MKNNKQLITIIVIVLGTVLPSLLSHGMNIFYNFLILPVLGLMAYIGVKRMWPIPVFGIFLGTCLWQFVAMGMDGMFEQKMYLETLTGAISIGLISLTLVMMGTALGGLFTYAFGKSSESVSEECPPEGQGKRLIRAFSGLLGLVLILGLASITNAFIGNPISAGLATNSAKTYIGEQYPQLDLVAEKASYNFKFDHYMVRVKSQKSMDTYFTIDLDSFGHVLEDDYQRSVLSGWNTYKRINDGFDVYVTSVIKKDLPYEYDMIIGQLDDKESSNMKGLERDKVYEPTDMPLKGLVTVYVYSSDLSWKNVAKVTLELNQVLENAHIEVAEYTVILEAKRDEKGNRGDSIGIYDFPKEKLNHPNLEEEMARFFEEWNKKSK